MDTNGYVINAKSNNQAPHVTEQRSASPDKLLLPHISAQVETWVSFILLLPSKLLDSYLVCQYYLQNTRTRWPFLPNRMGAAWAPPIVLSAGPPQQPLAGSRLPWHPVVCSPRGGLLG